MSDCPYCGQPVEDLHEEVAHMTAAHPDIVAERLVNAGLGPFPGVEWVPAPPDSELERRLADARLLAEKWRRDTRADVRMMGDDLKQVLDDG